MKTRWGWVVLAAIFVTIASSFQNSSAFVERKLALQEVISESTNIVFGKVEQVDEKRKRFIIKVDEDIKGESNLDQIKVNVAVGQRRGNLTSPEKFMNVLKVGEPAIMFYRHQGGSVESLGHTGGTWFQTRTGVGRKIPDVWWTFTHIEVRMHRTFKGSTAEFQDLLLRVMKPFEYAKPGDIKVLAFAKHRAIHEFDKLLTFHKIADKNVVYKSTQNQKLPELEKVDILWIGYRSLSEAHSGKYLFDTGTEDRIRTFVENGGVVILSGQDSDPNRSCGTGFLAKPIKGVEGKVRDGIQVVKDDGLFTTPEKIEADQVRVDDAWAEADSGYSVLALTKEDNVALAQLGYGKGMYIVTAMQNGRPEHLKSNAPLMTNLMDLAVRSLRSKSISMVR